MQLAVTKFIFLKSNFCVDFLTLKLEFTQTTVEIHLSRLIGMASYPDIQKIQIIGFFSENRPHWQFEVQLLLFTVCTRT